MVSVLANLLQVNNYYHLALLYLGLHTNFVQHTFHCECVYIYQLVVPLPSGDQQIYYMQSEEVGHASRALQ